MSKMPMDFWRKVFKEKMHTLKPGETWRLTMDRALDYHFAEPGWKPLVQEHAHGSFICTSCSRRWSSHQVIILFFLNPSEKRVKMKLFGQQCNECKSSSTFFEMPYFSKDDVDDIVEDLILDLRVQCYGEVLNQVRHLVAERHPGLPHQQDNCEACQLGIHKRGLLPLPNSTEPQWTQYDWEAGPLGIHKRGLPPLPNSTEPQRTQYDWEAGQLGTHKWGLPLPNSTEPQRTQDNRKAGQLGIHKWGLPLPNSTEPQRMLNCDVVIKCSNQEVNECREQNLQTSPRFPWGGLSLPQVTLRKACLPLISILGVSILITIILLFVFIFGSP